MGVLTHLDGFRDDEKLKKVKKALKHRFWTEIYQGAFRVLLLAIALPLCNVLLVTFMVVSPSSCCCTPCMHAAVCPQLNLIPISEA